MDYLSENRFKAAAVVAVLAVPLLTTAVSSAARGLAPDPETETTKELCVIKEKPDDFSVDADVWAPVSEYGGSPAASVQTHSSLANSSHRVGSRGHGDCAHLAAMPPRLCGGA